MSSKERAIYTQEWRKKNKEKIAIYNKEYKEKNKEKISILRKEYREENKEKLSNKHKEYLKTPAGKKSNRISNWKKQGIHIEDMNILYKWFLEATHCENCGKEFVGGKRNNLTKCIDHDHDVVNNNFRAILCSNCNVNQKDNNTSGTANIYLDKKNGNWIYKRTLNKIQHQKHFKTKHEAISYKNEFEATHIYSHQ